MDRAPISLGRAAFQRSFPFGFVVGRDGTFEVVGAGLARRIAEETHPDIAFEVVQPLTGGLAAASKKCGTIVCLRVAADGLELKGEVLCLDGGERYAVLATPVVRTLDEARESGLQLLDFPPHDPTPDRLLSMQAASTALSDARALSEKLETALTEARAAVEAKSRFLAVMSHELRTPMNGVGSMVDLLMGTELVEEQREVLSTIDLCARTLHVLVDDILDYSKLEADGVELESIPFDPVAVAEQAARLFEVSAQERGVEVSVELRPGVPRRILGDPHRVRQVLSNLVGNAVKFTEEGSVTLVLARSGERLSATVVDTGVGIPESAQPTLFEPFTQADVSTTRNHGGTGLGLTISRELARLMGGDVSLVESSERGTTFRFDFDFEHAEALARIGVQVAPFGEKTVAVHGVPARIKRPDPEAIVRDVVDVIARTGKAPDAEDVLEEVLHRASCRSSIMAGDVLDQDSIRALLERARASGADQTCPHARPTRVKFTLADLEKAFHRT
ncbi:MAG: ATP-binding protein [Planctomycetota bacterium]